MLLSVTGKPNQIATEDGIILIQSCDSRTANVGIVINNHTCYRTVSLPFLAQSEASRFIPWEMRDEDFASIVQKHAEAVMSLINRLNSNGKPNQ